MNDTLSYKFLLARGVYIDVVINRGIYEKYVTVYDWYNTIIARLPLARIGELPEPVLKRLDELLSASMHDGGQARRYYTTPYTRENFEADQHKRRDHLSYLAANTSAEMGHFPSPQLMYKWMRNNHPPAGMMLEPLPFPPDCDPEYRTYIAEYDVSA